MPKANAQENEPAAQWVSLSELKAWDRNPRKNGEAIKAVVKSIKRFGFGAPILARKADGEIIAGHTRLEAARKLGLERVPVRYLDLDPADAHLLALADNKLGEIAQWDDATLLALLGDLRQQGGDAAAVAGWTDADIDALLKEAADDALAAGEAKEVDAKEAHAEELRERWGVQTGQLWVIPASAGGAHRLLCGDATSTADRERVLCGEKPDAVFTDPPYEWTAERQVETVFAYAPVAVVSGCGPQYARIAGVPGVRFWYEVISLRTMPRSMPKWPGPFVMHWQNAFITTGGDHLFHRKFAKGRFGNGDYFPSVRGPYKCGEHDHGHSKSVAWAHEIISMMNAPIVADPFCGSGTAMVASDQCGRRCLAVEMEPKFVAVTLERLKDAGLTPTLDS